MSWWPMLAASFFGSEDLCEGHYRKYDERDGGKTYVYDDER